MRDHAPLFPRWLIALLALGGAGYALFALRGVLTPVFSAFLLAYMLDPVVDRIEARGLRRDVATTALLGALVGAFALVLLLVVPGVIRDVRAFLARVPGVLSEALATYGPLLESYGVVVPRSLEELVARLGAGGASLPDDAIGSMAAALRFVVGGTASALGAFAGASMVPVFAFYLLYDFDRMVASARELAPARHRDGVVALVREIDAVLGQFVRGQLIVMGALAALFALGYGLVGVRLALPIGITAGLLSFIPYLGAGVALGLGLLMVAFDGLGLGGVFGVVGVYTAIQLLEGFVITPWIVGDRVGLSSVGVLFALMVGGELFGFLGVLLAVPAAAVLKILLARAIEHYKSTELFLASASSAAPGPADRPAAESAPESAADSAPESPPGPESGPEPARAGHEAGAQLEPAPEPEANQEAPSNADEASSPVGC